jgi:class I fructose-bisphosphate aldolase
MSKKTRLTALEALLGENKDLLTHQALLSPAFLHTPSMKTVYQTLRDSDRSSAVQKSLHALYRHGRLGGTGYVNILPIDQGIEHSAVASFGVVPEAFDPEYLARLAYEGGCNAIASTYGTLAAVSRRYAHKIPFIVKLNHNELLTYPNKADQIMFCSPKQAKNMGAMGVGATIYFGSAESGRQIQEVSKAFAEAHELGMFTVLWCYLRNPAFKKGKIDYHTAADLSSQAVHLGVTIGADIIKQKLPTTDGGMKALNQEGSYGKTDDAAMKDLVTPHPIDRARLQVLHCYAGRIPLISSGGPSGKNDLKDAVESAVINKRAGGAGLIAGRKVFRKPFDEAVELLHAIQDVYLLKDVTVA